MFIFTPFEEVQLNLTYKPSERLSDELTARFLFCPEARGGEREPICVLNATFKRPMCPEASGHKLCLRIDPHFKSRWLCCLRDINFAYFPPKASGWYCNFNSFHSCELTQRINGNSGGRRYSQHPQYSELHLPRTSRYKYSMCSCLVKMMYKCI